MLEELPNEIFFQIFSFIELTELYQAFSSLNYRFECLLYNNFTPLYARLVSNITLPLDRFLFRISKLLLINLSPNNVLLLIENSNLPRLHYLNIESTNNDYFGQPTNILIHKILSLSKLFKCRIKLSPTLYIVDNQLLESQTIKHMNLSMITLDMLFNLLKHVPKLCSLNVWLNSNGRIFDSRTYNQYNCLNLKKLTIGLHNDIKFEEISFLLEHMPILKSFEIVGSVWDRGFLNEQKWKNILLGENLFPLLNKIKINIYIRYTVNVQNVKTILSHFNQEIFHRTNFVITHDYMFWFYLTCFWNS
ncbi:unnamed protein product [Rotaria sp. Silwood1]|nr:unnamed protein product [Rotaria sp. Silwood1]CAF3351426.1 unnamed protein product [Rotaria sp. Silwood1]CAF3421725.1 unnamed protein product [Rotaria sp. Silwood1]CAF4792593.1 unnamed protein product [Rotaria sp. Silwood1]CAF4820535.1 unnamed protein product [Rotaria sp. Silwood1]